MGLQMKTSTEGCGIVPHSVDDFKKHGEKKRKSPHCRGTKIISFLTLREVTECSQGTEWDSGPGVGADGSAGAARGRTTARAGVRRDPGKGRAGGELGRSGWLSPRAQCPVRFKLGPALAPCLSAAARLGVRTVCGPQDPTTWPGGPHGARPARRSLPVRFPSGWNRRSVSCSPDLLPPGWSPGAWAYAGPATGTSPICEAD